MPDRARKAPLFLKPSRESGGEFRTSLLHQESPMISEAFSR